MELDPQAILALVLAHDWFALTIPLSVLIVRLLNAKTELISKYLPEWLSWLPAFGVNFLIAWGTAASDEGATWKSAATGALIAVFTTPLAISMHHGLKRVPKIGPKYAGKVAKAASVLLLLGAVSLTSIATPGCAAWLPAVTAALATAHSLLDTIDGWANRWRRDVPTAPWARYDELMSQTRATLAQAQVLANSGEESRKEVDKLKAQVLANAKTLLAFLEESGLYAKGAFTVPQSAMKASPGMEPVDPVPFTLPAML